MDLTKASLLREMLTGTELGSRTTSFAHSMRRYTTRRGGLLLFGPPEDEPWHLTAHLDDELHRAGVEDVRPALVRWTPPPGAPPHLAIGLDRLRESGRGESLLVVAEDRPADTLLERIDDVRRRGTTIFSIDNGDKELAGLAHESLVPELLVPAGFGSWANHSVTEDAVRRTEGAVDDEIPDETLTALREAVAGFEMTQHLVSLAAADPEAGQANWRRSLRTFIERLGGEPG
ncbi:hypothetical protein Kfla_0250 [Kribbella flavida DSM 17836]|uniref:Uncharacterized protein n=1 Tax=Kribbella flavida (strain DSM 17836 / JCM 10339 / NBRC 14399) TaxID=479435 RepID=D2PT59_KRIFD|nr:hypothetical protein [Kribbella flavida]ADB29375.1 hypothetical protein Kfla_0250 [Kribbella flavida DSM 17836]